MRMTVVVPDNMVSVDRKPKEVDLSFLPKDIHAFQWYGEYGIGEIEYVYDFLTNHKKPNERVSELGIFQQALDLYNQAP